MNHSGKIIVAAILASALAASSANAAVTVNISETGGDVVATTFGSLNTSGFIPAGTATNNIQINGGSYFFTGTNYALMNAYSGITGPDFGDFMYTGASSSTGTPFGFTINGRLFLTQSYVSGSAISATTTFKYETLAKLGLTIGSFVYSIGTQQVTLNIGQTAVPAVPEPASWAMMLAGFGMIGFAARRRSAVKATVRYA